MTIKKIAIAVVVLFLALWGLWVFAVPEAFLAGYLQRTLSGPSIALELTGFKKGFFFTLHAERVSVNKRAPRSTRPPGSPAGGGEGAAFVVIENLDLAPDMLSLLQLSPRFDFSGRIGQGAIRGTAGREGGGAGATVHGERIDVGSLPILAQAGIHGEGNLTFDFRWQESRGEVAFSIDNARLSGVLAGNGAVPLNFFKSVKGLFTLGNTITVNSLALEGPGIYVRVKGEIREGGLDGRAEVMVDTSFPQYPLLQPILERYKVSPGYYVIPFSQAGWTSGEQP